MANNKIQVKRTNVTGRTANVTSAGNAQYIDAGEFALNMADGILYTSNGSALIAVGANNTTISSGNSTVNLFANSTFLRIANSSTSSNLTSSSLIAGISTVNTTVIAVGSNNFMNATALDIGNTIITTTNAVFGGTIAANGGIGTSGQVLTSGAAGNVYWSTVTSGGSGTVTSVASGNGITGGTITTTGTLTAVVGSTQTLNSTGIHVNSTLSITTLTTSGNVTIGAGVTANGGVGSAGQVLKSGGSGANVYWAADLNSGTVTSVASGNGIIGGTITATGTLYVDGANGISVDASGVNVLAGNSQLVSNATGVWVNQGQIDHNSLSNYVADRHIAHSGVAITAGNGLTGGGNIDASRTLDVGAANGITVAADSIAVTEGVGLVVNTTGVHVKSNTGIVANATGTFVNASYIATITANNATYINGNTVLTVMESLRANRALHGGGTITVDGSGNVLWSARFIVISNGRGTHFSTAGYFDINCPTSGTITGVGGSTNKTATAAGIPLASGSWEALYYIMPIGSGAAPLSANFRVVSFTSDVEIPSDWLLICVVNGDNGNYYFNNGIILKAGQSFVGGTFTSANMPQANNANNLGGTAAASYVQNTDSRTLSGNLVISGTSFTPSSNTILLGNSTQRWVLSANTGSFSGAVSGITTLAAGNTTITGFANVTTSVNSALLTVGSIFIANTTQLTTTVPFSANGGTGTSGQVLTSNGATGSPYWASAAGGGYYKGGTAAVGSLAVGGQNLFRVNANTLNTSTTFVAGENAQATGPIAVASGITLTVQSGARVSIV